MTLVYLALAWLVGIALGAAANQPWPLWLAVALAGALAALLMRRERQWRLGGTMLALAAFGALRVAASPLHATPLRPYLDGSAVTLTGTIAEAPDPRTDRLELVLRVDSICRGGVSPPSYRGVSPPRAEDEGISSVQDPPQPAPEGEETLPLRDAILLRVPRASPYRYGDRLLVTGVVRTPAGMPGFSYRDYLARRGIHGLMEPTAVTLLGHDADSPIQAALIALADRAEAAVYTLWPAPESALMAGILLGRERGLPDPLLQAFDDTGTRHIIAISGFNITLLAGVLSSMLLTLLNRRAAVPVVILLLAFYVALVGGDAAVVRAGLMGGLTLLALLAGRRSDALTGLAASAFAMTAWRPWTLWEPSFQLSFAATLGLIVLEPRMESWIEGRCGSRTAPTPGNDGTAKAHRRTLGGADRPRLPNWLREALLVSLAAQIATLPITLGTFGRLSLVAPLANLLILPAQAAVMELGALATLLALLWRPAGQLVAYLAWPFAAWTIAAVERLGALSWAAVDLHVAGLVPWLVYALGGLLLWARSTPGRWQSLTHHLPTKTLLASLAAAAAVVWIGGVARAPDGRLHVTVLDVGQGDAILIRTPDGKHLLVDGGPDPTTTVAALGRRLYPWQRTVDLLALTHPDEDHLAGLLPVAQRYRSAFVLDTYLPRDTPTGQAWQTTLASLDAQGPSPFTHHVSRITYPTQGALLDLGSGVRLQVLHPGETPLAGTRSDSNNNGLALRLTWGQASFLLMGDLEAEAEAALLRQRDVDLASTVLKVAHHGSQYGSTLRFLEAARPQVAVISVGTGNRYGHPAPEVLARLQQVGAQVWRTDECGDVEVVTDGERLWVRTGR